MIYDTCVLSVSSIIIIISIIIVVVIVLCIINFVMYLTYSFFVCSLQAAGSNFGCINQLFLTLCVFIMMLRYITFPSLSLSLIISVSYAFFLPSLLFIDQTESKFKFFC